MEREGLVTQQVKCENNCLQSVSEINFSFSRDDSEDDEALMALMEEIHQELISEGEIIQAIH